MPPERESGPVPFHGLHIELEPRQPGFGIGYGCVLSDTTGASGHEGHENQGEAPPHQRRQSTRIDH
jgi:hypothetical protein